MSLARPRLAAAVALLGFAAAALAPSTGQAATIKACQHKKSGDLRIAKKCRKSERRVTWNTNGTKGAKGEKGDKGTNGTNGTNGSAGANGAPGPQGIPGQPQSVQRFSGSQPSGNSSIDLFTSSGVSYRFRCQFALVANVVQLRANGPSGSTYAQGSLARPTGIDRLGSDPWSSHTLATLGGGEEVIASHSTLSDSEGSIVQNGVYTATVEGPSATTFLSFRMTAAATCTIQGAAITIPN